MQNSPTAPAWGIWKPKLTYQRPENWEHAACNPSKINRKVPISHDPTLYRSRRKIEILFGRLKDWRRVHTRYDRRAHTFMSAIALAAIVIFWL